MREKTNRMSAKRKRLRGQINHMPVKREVAARERQMELTFGAVLWFYQGCQV